VYYEKAMKKQAQKINIDCWHNGRQNHAGMFVNANIVFTSLLNPRDLRCVLSI